MERSNRIPLDEEFAGQLDANCGVCMRGIIDNTPQLETIKARIPSTTGEEKALAGLNAQCLRCFENGGNHLNAITTISSRHWRAGIK